MSVPVITPKNIYDAQNEGAFREEVRRKLAGSYDRRGDVVVPFGKRLAFTSAQGQTIYFGYNTDGDFTIQQDATTPFGLASLSYVSTVQTDLETSFAALEVDVEAANDAAAAAATSAIAAASSATAAGTSATAAATSATTASTQAGNASTSASQASTSATNAAGSASTASTQATNAATSATNASNSASAASTSASTASTQATNAGTSASNAATSATNAATSATAAGGSATAAATSASTASTQATNSSNSATASAASAVTASSAKDAANLTATLLFPETFAQDSQFWSPTTTGLASANVAVLSGSFSDVSGIGRVYQKAGFENICPRGTLPAVPNAVYEMEVKARVTVDSSVTGGTKEQAIANSWHSLNSDGTAYGYVTATVVAGFIASKSTFRVADGWLVFKVRYTIPASPAFALLRPRFYQGYDAGGNGNATMQVAYIKITDVTNVAASEVSASAAATSASSASTSATAAGTSATAASTSATNAATSAGAASTSATNASTSATTASGHASTASTQATAAANSATAAAGSATAASTSASTASTQATNAGNSATAASASAVTARSVANRLLPDRPGDDPDAFTAAYTTYASPTSLSAGVVVAVAGEGNVYQITSDAVADIATKGFLNVVTGRTYRLTMRVRVTTDGTGTNQFLSWFRSFNASGTYLAAHSGPVDTSAVVADGWQTLTADITAATILAAQPTAVYIRADMRGGGATGAVWQCAYLQSRDASSEVAAAASASAASTSASSASTSATAAGTSATAAATSATAASTSSGSASTSASSASTSATNAATSASAAATSATTAATYYLNRLGSQMADRPSVGDDFSSTLSSGTPSSLAALSAGTVVNVANEGDVRQFTSNNTFITRGWLPVLTGNTYRLTHRTRVTVDGTGNILAHYFSIYASDGTYLGVVGSATPDVTHVVADGWQTFSSTTTGATILAAFATAAFVRARLWGGRKVDTTASGSTWQVASFKLEDITEITATNANVTTNTTAIATANTAISTLDTRVSAQISTPAEGMLFNSKFMLDLVASLPPNWTNWVNGTGTAVARNGHATAKAFRLVGGAGASAGLQQYAGPNDSIIAARRYLVRATTWLVSGTYNGAGVYIDWRNSAGTSVGTTTIGFANTANTNGVTSNAHVGLTSWEVAATAPTGAARALVYAMSHWSSLSGGATVANSIDWYECDLVPESLVSASVTTNAAAITTVDGKLTASYGVTVDGNGRIASMKLLSNGATSDVKFLASTFQVYNGTTDEAPFVVEGGVVKAKKVQAASLSAITATIGLLRTATTGARTEIEDNVIRVYDSSNVLRVRMGIWT